MTLQHLAFPLALAAGCGLQPAVSAANTNVPCSADTTLSENWLNDNLGGLNFFNAGSTQNYTRNRALLKFDLAGYIPSGSRIRAVSMVLEVVGVPSEPAPFAEYGLHRMLRSWGEGVKVSPTGCTSCAGAGATATLNEASWLSPLSLTGVLWGQPGGGTNDYVASASSGFTAYGVGESPYQVLSTAAAVADVQQWLINPQSNFGWMLKAKTEDVSFTARRIASRESGIGPYLQIDFVAPPTLSITKSGGTVQLSFRALAGQSYSVEYKALPDTGSWQTFVNLGLISEASRVVVVEVPVASSRVYRVRTW